MSHANLPDVIERGGRLSFSDIPQHRRTGLYPKRECVTAVGCKGMDMKVFLQSRAALLQLEPDGGLSAATEAVQFAHPASVFGSETLGVQ